MLLIQLEAKEKFAFLKLAHYIAKSDGDYSTQEKEIIEEYCFEMGIDNFELPFESIDIDEVINTFRCKKSKCIILMELMILAHCDDTYNEAENAILSNLAKKLDITQKELKMFSNWGKAVSSLRNQAILMSLD